jgi:hypothetical protein
MLYSHVSFAGKPNGIAAQGNCRAPKMLGSKIQTLFHGMQKKQAQLGDLSL